MQQASQDLPFAPLPERALDFTEPSIDRPAKVDPTESAAGFAHVFSLPLLQAPGLREEPVLEDEQVLEENDSLTAPSTAANEAEKSGPTLASEELQSPPQDLENISNTLPPAAQADAPWSSAAKARSFLEALSQTRTPGAFARFWRARRGDFYLAVAVILVLVAICWGMLSNHSVRATDGAPTAVGNALRRKPPADDLSLFDKLLINLGLAEAPKLRNTSISGIRARRCGSILIQLSTIARAPNCMEKRRKADSPASTKLSSTSSNPRPAEHAIEANYWLPARN